MTTGHPNPLGAPALIAVAFALLVPVQVEAGQAPATTCSIPCWIGAGTPLYAQVGPYDAIWIGYTNLSNGNVTGIVFAVIHNSLGQTVDISTGTLQLPAGANGTAFAVVFGLPDGEYSGTLFATSISGTALSTTTTIAFTATVTD
jgi:hypothetical protein